MTDKEIDKLANKIADIIFKRQEEYDAQFQIDMENIAEESIMYTYKIDETTTSTTRSIIPDLESDLKASIDKEDYEQAAKLAAEIKKLKK